MERLVMRRCCCRCGCSVHSCAIVNAVFSALVCLAIVVSAILEIILVEDHRNTFVAAVMKYDADDVVVDKQVEQLSRQFCYVFLINGVLGVAVAICSLYGILMRRKEFVLPWLIVNGVSMMGLVFATVIFSVIFPWGLLMGFILPFYVYMYVIAHSFYFRLSAAESRAAARDAEQQQGKPKN